jgi:hypothetical protein
MLLVGGLTGFRKVGLAITEVQAFGRIGAVTEPELSSEVE